MQRRDHAFSLVELLVVMSVIGVLAALLLSAIGVVRDSARSATCSGSMRQFGGAFLVYTDDHDGRFPIGEWNPLIQSYIDDDNAAVCLRLAKCPAAPAKTNAGAIIGSTYAYPGVYWASWNVGPIFNDPQQFLFAWPWWLWSPHKISIGRMRLSSQKCLLDERWDETAASIASVAWGSNVLNDQKVTLAHRGTSNFLFADGHVQPLPVTGVKKWSSIQWSGDPMWRPYNTTASTRIK